MKLLILACLLGFSAADFLQDAAPAVDASVSSFLHGISKVGSLSDALGFDDSILQQLADDIETEFGKKVKETFQELLEKIKENVDNGKAVGQELLKKVKELQQKLKDLGLDIGDKAKETLKKIKEKAKETLKNILERLGRRNMDDSMDQVARMTFRDIVQKIEDKMSSKESIQKIREYVNNLKDTPLSRTIKDLVSKISDERLKELIGHLLDYKTGRQDKRSADKIRDFFKDLDLQIQERGKRFGQWVRNVWGEGLDELKRKYGAVKAVAMEFITNAKDTTAETTKEAFEFFRPYEKDLGTLWKQIVDATKEAIGKF